MTSSLEGMCTKPYYFVTKANRNMERSHSHLGPPSRDHCGQPWRSEIACRSGDQPRVGSGCLLYGLTVKTATRAPVIHCKYAHYSFRHTHSSVF